METAAKHTVDDLWALYTDGEGVDQEFFAEGRSNILLYAGDHYNRRSSAFYKRIRDSKELTEQQKLRLTKNHIQYVCDTYVNNIIAPNPGVGFTAKNEKEPHDQKVAQLHHAVWRDAHERYNIDDKIDDWADNFVQQGEAIVKIYYDPSKGKLKAYEQKVDDDGNPLFLDPATGQPTPVPTDEMGQPLEPVQDEEKPIYTGEFCFEEVYSFNLIRPAECKDLREASWLAVRKMVDKKTLEAQFPGKLNLLKESGEQTYMVFDASRGGYTKTSGQCLLVEYYFRPCHEYPNGYFYITTREGILAEGELPGGIFPIVIQTFRKFATTPRGRSPIKTMRPYQAEHNRAMSKIAEHQVTLGDDKLLIQNGTKVSSGAQLPGIRSVNYTGAEPKILNGRDGSQYLNTANQNLAEMYQVMGVKDDTEELPAQLDAYVMLYRSARTKKKFQRYIKRFEKFLINVVKTYIQLAKVHLPDDTVIQMIGSTERVNIAEFRSVDDLCYEIKLEAQSEDVETKLGKQIVINNALQYVGGRLDKEDIGKLMRQMPYANFDASFEDMTIDYDNWMNDQLALDRGEKPPVHQNENHPYMIKKLSARMKKSDFRFLPPQVQQNYVEKVKLHQQFEAMNQMAIQRAKQGLIPTDGYLASCQLYVPDPNNPNKSMQVKLPANALGWLVKQLQAQQAGIAPIMDMSSGDQAGIAQQVTQMSGTGVDSPTAQAAINTQAMAPA